VQHLKQAPRIALFIAVEQRPLDIPTIERFRQRHRRKNLWRVEAFGLFGRFARDRVQAIETNSLSDSALREDGAKAAHAKLGCLFYDEVGGVTLHRREHEV
jgi:hypothetical protein